MTEQLENARKVAENNNVGAGAAKETNSEEEDRILNQALATKDKQIRKLRGSKAKLLFYFALSRVLIRQFTTL